MTAENLPSTPCGIAKRHPLLGLLVAQALGAFNDNAWKQIVTVLVIGRDGKRRGVAAASRPGPDHPPDPAAPLQSSGRGPGRPPEQADGDPGHEGPGTGAHGAGHGLALLPSRRGDCRRWRSSACWGFRPPSSARPSTESCPSSCLTRSCRRETGSSRCGRTWP